MQAGLQKILNFLTRHLGTDWIGAMRLRHWNGAGKASGRGEAARLKILPE